MRAWLIGGAVAIAVVVFGWFLAFEAGAQTERSRLNNKCDEEGMSAQRKANSLRELLHAEEALERREELKRAVLKGRCADELVFSGDAASRSDSHVTHDGRCFIKRWQGDVYEYKWIEVKLP